MAKLLKDKDSYNFLNAKTECNTTETKFLKPDI